MSHEFTITGGVAVRGTPFSIFGIVNATPDSFFDGTGSISPAKAIARARKVWKEGAQVLDIGGESTRPYAPVVSPEEELARLLPVLRAARNFSASPFYESPVLSIDTRRASVAAACLAEDAHIINDVSGCADPAMPELLASHKPGYVLMHTKGDPDSMQDDPRYGDVVAEVLDFFSRTMARLTAAGLPEDRILLDPGIGFGKRLEHNLALLRALPRLSELGRPILLGISNKSLFGDLLGLPKDKRGGATQVLTALAAAQGVMYHRVHDVRPAREALEIAHALGNS